MVGRRAELVLHKRWRDLGITPHSQLVVIASHGGIDAERLTNLFNRCELDAHREVHFDCSFDDRA